jgi:biotin carboxylase
LARYDETLADAISMAPDRPEAHYCVATESGMMIVDVWASRADLQRAILENEDFQAKQLESLGYRVTLEPAA